MLAAAFLFACGGDEGGDAPEAVEKAAEEVTGAVHEATEEAAEAVEAAGEGMEAAGEAMSEASAEPIKVIDQTKAEAEFRVKQTLAGVESLIEDIKAAGGDTSDLEAQKKELEGQLKSL
jgi:hypothetical protein